MEHIEEKYELMEELFNVLLWFHNYSYGYLIPAYYKCHIQDALHYYSIINSVKDPDEAFAKFKDMVYTLKSETADLIQNGKRFGEN